MPQVNCKICKKEFYTKPCHQKLGYGKFCSRACHFQSQRKGRYVLCAICRTESWKQPKALNGSASGKFFCGKSCQTKWRNKSFSREKHPNWLGGEHTYQRIMKEAKIPPACNMCGLKDERVLIVHHIDHNKKHNVIKNLMWLCRNCHYLIHERKTF